MSLLDTFTARLILGISCTTWPPNHFSMPGCRDTVRLFWPGTPKTSAKSVTSASGKEQGIQIFSCFKRNYNLRSYCLGLHSAEETTPKTCHPMECLQVAGLQRYNHKLGFHQCHSENRAANLITFHCRQRTRNFDFELLQARLQLDALLPRVPYGGNSVEDLLPMGPFKSLGCGAPQVERFNNTVMEIR